MSGQCLSPSELGHALTPSTHHCLGRPLPHQQANRTRTHPQTELHLWSLDVIRYYPQFPAAIPDPRADIHALLSLSPLTSVLLPWSVRLACLIHAANVHSEPGSNPSIVVSAGHVPPREDQVLATAKRLRITCQMKKFGFVQTTAG